MKEISFSLVSSWKGPLSFLDDPIVDLKNMENKMLHIFNKRGWDKSPSLKIVLDCRARRSG